MTISNVAASAGLAQVMAATQAKAPESAEGARPDNDGDKDDTGGVAATQQAAPASGTGSAVNKVA